MQLLLKRPGTCVLKTPKLPEQTQFEAEKEGKEEAFYHFFLCWNTSTDSHQNQLDHEYHSNHNFTHFSPAPL